MIKSDAVNLVKAYLKEAGKEALMKDADLYKAMVKDTTYSIDLTKRIQKKFPAFTGCAYMEFFALFRDHEARDVFVAILSSLEYVIDSYAEYEVVNRGVSDKSILQVRFKKRIDSFNIRETTRYSLEVVEIIHRLGGVYGNWGTNGSLAISRKHTDPVTGIKWHRFTKSYNPYPEVAWFLYRPAYGFDYAEDEQLEEFFSKLKKRDVTLLMQKLRAGEGRIPAPYLQHFEDKHIEEVKEILARGYYIDDGGNLFTEIALSLFRMEQEKLAIELAIHGVANGEDHEQFMESAEDQDEEMGTNFARDFSRVKTYRDLQIQIGENSTVSSKAKLKV